VNIGRTSSNLLAATTIALTILLINGHAASGQTTPSIRVSPSAGSAGTLVHLVGSGFCTRGCSDVAIQLGHILVARGLKPASGSIASDFYVPDGTTGGNNQIEADQTDAAGNTVRSYTSFYVTISQPPPGGARHTLPTTTNTRATTRTTSPPHPATTTTSTLHNPTSTAARSSTTRVASAPTSGSGSAGSDNSWIGVAIGTVIAAGLIAGLRLRQRRRAAAR
jgi:hypothetical protein